MSKFDELIQELCPDGVEFKSLGEVCKINAYPQLGAAELEDLRVENGDISLLPSSANYTWKTTADKAAEYVCEGEIFTFGRARYANAKYIKGKFISANNIIIESADKNFLLTRFIFHFALANIDRIYTVTSTYPKFDKDVFQTLKIPVPPLEVQREIIRILDNFTEQIAELKDALAAELTARKLQYEYYSDTVLNKANESTCPVFSVEECIVSLKTGLNPRQNFKLNENGSVLPYITGKDVFNNTINVSDRTDKITPEALELINRRARLEAGLVLFASTGTGTVGRMAIVNNYNNDWGISETLYAIKVKEEVILPKYLMYALYSKTAKEQFEPKISKGSVPHLKVADLLRVKIAVPPIEEQKKVIDILDRFDALCNDISDGLPAEIEARQKQYEYYRDKLLTFKEVGT